MGKRGLYSTISLKNTSTTTREMMNVLAYCDGQHDGELIQLRTGLTAERVDEALSALAAEKLVSE